MWVEIGQESRVRPTAFWHVVFSHFPDTWSDLLTILDLRLFSYQPLQKQLAVELPSTLEARLESAQTLSKRVLPDTDLLENGLEDMGRGKGKL